jgi:hypothetical protein
VDGIRVRVRVNIKVKVRGRGRVRVRVRVASGLAFSVWTGFTVPTGERSDHPRGMSLVTRMQSLQCNRFNRSKGVKLNGTLDCKFHPQA